MAQEAWVRLIERQRAGRLKLLRLPGLVIAQADWLARESCRTERRRAGLLGQSAALEDVTTDLEFAESALDPAQRAAPRERVEAIQQELLRCTPRARQVFQAVYGPTLTRPADVASELGLSLQRVRQILCEVRARMRRVLVEMEGEDEPWNT